LRDPSADLSLTVTAHRDVLDAGAPELAEGARVTLHAKPEFYPSRGTLSLRADEIRQVGLGELLARLERLKKLLAAEGLFARERKRRLPFLPRRIGLITGRASAAERDVLMNTRRRWPAVAFRVINVAVQGPTAVPQIIDALKVLDSDDTVDVIVLGPRRRQRRGPAAVLRRGAVPGGVRGAHTGDERDRPRDRRAAGRLTWPTCARPRPPTRPSAWCRIWPRNGSSSTPRGAGWTARSARCSTGRRSGSRHGGPGPRWPGRS
jgi:hypothetical protein